MPSLNELGKPTGVSLFGCREYVGPNRPQWDKLVEELEFDLSFPKPRKSYEDVAIAVNAFVNLWPYKPDHGESWASPNVFLTEGGDCEDYAICKYLWLRSFGIDADRLRIVALRDIKKREAHAVLAFNNQNDWWILDIKSNAYARHTDYHFYIPEWSVNEEGSWVYFPSS